MIIITLEEIEGGKVAAKSTFENSTPLEIYYNNLIYASLPFRSKTMKGEEKWATEKQ